MTGSILPILRSRRELSLTLAFVAVALANTGAGCSGGGVEPPKPHEREGPLAGTGAEFPITSARLEAQVFNLRPGEALPTDTLQLINEHSQSLPESLRTSLAARGFAGAIMNEEAVDRLARSLTAKPLSLPVNLPPAPPPPPPSANGANPSLSPGVSVIGGLPPANAPTPPPEPIISAVPRGSAVGDVAAISIRPGAAWVPLLDAPTRTEPWALALGPSAASMKPGTLRWFVRTWPSPTDAVPTAGIAAELRVQFLPVVTGPLYEATPDPLAPPPLSTDLAARGLVLGRQSFSTGLRGRSSLVLIALPVSESARGPGPQTEAAPMLGQALLGAGPAPTPAAKPTGPRVLVLRAVVPETYRLLLDRPGGPASER